MLARYIRNYCFRISIKSQIKFLKGKFIMNETKQKTASFLVGAGFSYALNGFPCTKEFSVEIKTTVLNTIEPLCSNNEESQVFYKWLSKYSHDGYWNFEKISDLVEDLRSLKAAAYPGLPDHNLLKTVLNTIKTELCKKYLELTLSDNDLYQQGSCKFKKLTRSLLEDGYEIHFFDLNFDLVAENIFRDLASETEAITFNDFFEKSDSRKIQRAQESLFTPEFVGKNGTINLYKLHGAFNIINIGDLSRNHAPAITANGSSINRGFIKVDLNQNIIGTPQRKIDALKENFDQAISKLINIESDEKSDEKIESSLLIGNLSKLITKGFAPSYPKFCYEQFNKKILDSELIFIIGYSGADLDINSTLLERFKTTSSFFDWKDTNICKTVVYSEPQNKKYPLCKQSDDKNFEDYLQDLEKSGN